MVGPRPGDGTASTTARVRLLRSLLPLLRRNLRSGHNKRTIGLPAAHKLGSDLGQPAAGVSNHQAMAPAIEVEHSCIWQLPPNQAGIDGRNGCVLRGVWVGVWVGGHRRGEQE